MRKRKIPKSDEKLVPNFPNAKFRLRFLLIIKLLDYYLLFHFLSEMGKWIS